MVAPELRVYAHPNDTSSSNLCPPSIFRLSTKARRISRFLLLVISIRPVVLVQRKLEFCLTGKSDDDELHVNKFAASCREGLSRSCQSRNNATSHGQIFDL